MAFFENSEKEDLLFINFATGIKKDTPDNLQVLSLSELAKSFGRSKNMAAAVVFEVKKEIYSLLYPKDGEIRTLDRAIYGAQASLRKELRNRANAYNQLIEDLKQKSIPELQNVKNFNHLVQVKEILESRLNEAELEEAAAFNELEENFKNAPDTELEFTRFQELEKTLEDSKRKIKNLKRKLRILNQIINRYHLRITPLTYLLDDSTVYHKTVKYIFNNWRRFSKSSEDESVDDGTSKNDANLINEIQQNDTKDITESFSTAIKNYLTLIPVKNTKGEITKFVPMSTAISTLSNLLYNQIDLYSLSKAEDYYFVRNTLDSIQFQEVFNEEEQAVMNRLKSTLDDFSLRFEWSQEADAYIDSTPKDFTVYVDTFDVVNKFKGAFYIISINPSVKNKDKIDLRGMSPQQAKATYGDKIIIKKYEDLYKAYDENEGREDDIERLYRISRAFDELSNIRTYLGSLARVHYVEIKDTTKFSRSNEDGESSHSLSRYSRINKKATASTTFKTREQIYTLFTDLLSGRLTLKIPETNQDDIETYKSVKIDANNFDKIIGGMISKIGSYKNLDKAKIELHKLLNILNLGHLLKVSGTKSLDSIVSRIITALESIQEDFAKDKELLSLFQQYITDENKDNYDDLRNTIANRTSVQFLANALADLAKVQASNKQMNSVRGPDGKLLMEYIPTNSFREMLKDYHRLMNKGHSRYLNSPFFKHNIFISGINDVIDFDSRFLAKVSGKYHIYADKMTNAQRLQIFMSDLFFTSIAKVHDYREATYLQPPHQQGMATKTELATVKFLGLEKVIEALNMMMDQLEVLDDNWTSYKGYNKEQRLNFSIYDTAVAKVKQTHPNLTKESNKEQYRTELVKVMLTELMEEAKRTAQFLKESNLPLNNSVNSAYNVIRRGFRSDIMSEELQAHVRELLDESKLEIKTTSNGKESSKDKKISFVPHLNSFRESEYPEDSMFNLMAFAYVANNYVNSFGLSQFAMGDFNQFKSVAQLAKRGQLGVSPGYLPLIDDQYGAPRYTNILMVNDVLTSSKEYADKLAKFNIDPKKLQNIINQIQIDQNNFTSIERTDGTIFITPRLYYKLQKGFGSGLDLKSSIKDQAFGWSEEYIPDRSVGYETHWDAKRALGLPSHAAFVEGVHFTIEQDPKTNKPVTYLNKIKSNPIGLKNAIVVLDDAFIESTTQNAESRKQLKRLREFIDQDENNIDMLVFKSANKTIAPEPATLFTENGQFEENPTIDTSKNILRMDMSLFKVQYNPFSDDTTTALPRQILHFLSTIENPSYAIEAYTALAALQNTLYQNKFGKGRVDEKLLRKLLVESSKRSDSDFAIQMALEAGLPMDHPTLLQKVVSTLGAKLNKLASRIRLPGGKLILRTDVGFTFNRKYKDTDGKIKTKTDKLQMGVTPSGTAYAEASVPSYFLTESQKRAIREGKPLFIVPDMFGFRIPSGDLNAGLLVKVVDFYDVTGTTNIVILPDSEILKQGWDFDIDALFILKMEDYELDLTLTNIRLQKDTPAGFLPLSEEKAAKAYWSYDIEDSKQFETVEQEILDEIQVQQALINKEQDKKAALQVQVDKLIKEREATPSNEVTLKSPEEIALDKINDEIKIFTNKIKALKKARESVLKNRILKAIMNAYMDPKNNHRILDVTTTKVIHQAIDMLTKKGMFNPDAISDLSFPLHNIRQYHNVKESATAIGIYAKGSSIAAYTSRASKDQSFPSFAKKLHFNIDGKQVTKFSHESIFGGTKLNSFSLLNSLTLGFRKASGNPAIFDLGLNGGNAKYIETALFLDQFPLEAIIFLMNNRLIKKAIENETFTTLMNIIGHLIIVKTPQGSQILNDYLELQITTDEIQKAAIEFSNNTETIFQSIILHAQKLPVTHEKGIFEQDSEQIISNLFQDINQNQNIASELLNLSDSFSGAIQLDYSSLSNEDKIINHENLHKSRLYYILYLLQINLSQFKAFMLMHKIYTLANEKKKLLALINLPQDKPTTIFEIFNFTKNLYSIFKPQAIDLITDYLSDLPNDLEASAFSRHIKCRLNKIREYIQTRNTNNKGENINLKSDYNFSELMTSIYESEDVVKPHSLLANDMLIDVEKILEANPHITVALIHSLQHIQNLKDNFAILSDKAVSIINEFEIESSTNVLNAGLKKYYALLVLSDLIVSAFAEDTLNYDAISSKLSSKDGNLIETRGTTAFINDTILMIQAIQDFEDAQFNQNPDYVKNQFLEKLLIRPGANPEIRSSESTGAQSFEDDDIHMAFDDLAYFDLTEQTDEHGNFVKYEVTYDPTRQESVLQRNLVKYAALKNGLRGGAGTFTNAISPTYLAGITKHINNLYQIWIKNNNNTKGLRDLFALAVASQYPDSFTTINKYLHSSQVICSYDKSGKEYFKQKFGDNLFPTGVHGDLIMTIGQTSPPTILRVTENKKGDYFLILAGVYEENLSKEAYAIYHEMKSGNVMLTSRPYVLKQHFRTDKPTIKFSTKTKFDIHSISVLDEQGDTIENTFEYPYNEKYFKDKKIQDFVYGVYNNDVARHRISLLAVLNVDTFKQDKFIRFKVIEDNIGYKQFNPETNQYNLIPTQKMINEEFDNTSSFKHQHTSRPDGFPPVQKLHPDHVLVYLTNNKNLPISGQAKKAFGQYSPLLPNNYKQIKNGLVAEIGKTEEVVRGSAGYGYGLPVNTVSNLYRKNETSLLEEVPVTNKKLVEVIAKLIETATNDPSRKYLLTINNTNDLYKFSSKQFAEALIKTGMPLPSNLIVNNAFDNELKQHIA